MKTLKLTGASPAIRQRQRIEQTIALVAAQALLEDGFLLGVHDGEELVMHHSKSLEQVHSALFSTDEDYLYVYVKDDDKRDPRPQYWIRFVYGNSGWDVISDYSVKLDPYIGEGTVVQKLIDYAEENGTVIGFNGGKGTGWEPA